MINKIDFIREEYFKNTNGTSVDEIKIKFSGFCTNVLRLLFETRHKLSFSDLRVYMNLMQRCSCKNKILFSFPSYASIKTQTGLANSQVAKSMQRLQACGLILLVKSVKRGSRQLNNVYFIMDLLSYVEFDEAYMKSVFSLYNFNMSFYEYIDKYRHAKSLFEKFKNDMLVEFAYRNEAPRKSLEQILKEPVEGDFGVSKKATA